MSNVFAEMNEEYFRRCREHLWTDYRGTKVTMTFDPSSPGNVRENVKYWRNPYVPMSDKDWDEAMTTPIS